MSIESGAPHLCTPEECYVNRTSIRTISTCQGRAMFDIRCALLPYLCKINRVDYDRDSKSSPAREILPAPCTIYPSRICCCARRFERPTSGARGRLMTFTQPDGIGSVLHYTRLKFDERVIQ